MPCHVVDHQKAVFSCRNFLVGLHELLVGDSICMVSCYFPDISMVEASKEDDVTSVESDVFGNIVIYLGEVDRSDLLVLPH